MTDDLPTPPLPEAMASTRVEGAIAVSGASSRAFEWARAMRRRARRVHCRDPHVDGPHPVQRPHWFTTSRSDLAAQGQEAMVRATSTTTSTPLERDAADHAEVHDGVAQLGVDHRPQAVADLVLSVLPATPFPRRRRHCGGRGHGSQLYLRGGDFRRGRPLVPLSGRRR